MAPANIDVCAACHGEDGSGTGYDYVPIIAGTPSAHLEEALFAYQDGARKCVGVPVMCEAIAPLAENEVVEMAAYYSAMPRISSDDDVENALGIPLNGQRAAYLRLALGAYLTGDRETLVPIMADKLKELDQGKIDALIHYYSSWDPES